MAKKIVKIKLLEGQKNARLFHPTKGEMDLGFLTTKQLTELYYEKGYRHLFEK